MQSWLLSEQHRAINCMLEYYCSVELSPSAFLEHCLGPKTVFNLFSVIWCRNVSMLSALLITQLLVLHDASYLLGSLTLNRSGSELRKIASVMMKMIFIMYFSKESYTGFLLPALGAGYLDKWKTGWLARAPKYPGLAIQIDWLWFEEEWMTSYHGQGPDILA